MRSVRILLATLSGFSLCSCSFNHQYKKAVAAYEAGQYKAPSGPWQGTWTTKTNGHTGNLRAIVTPSDDNPGEYDFRYHATWAKILSGGYTVTYPTEQRGGRYFVDGEENLGFFGNFGHKAIVDDDSFEATYSNDKGDLGKFSMRRPE